MINNLTKRKKTGPKPQSKEPPRIRPTRSQIHEVRIFNKDGKLTKTISKEKLRKKHWKDYYNSTGMDTKLSSDPVFIHPAKDSWLE